jgi:dTMP kinase
VIYLDVPTDFTEKMMRSREAATNTSADIHEKDLTYLATCRQTGRMAAEFYGWKVIHCVKDGQMRSIEDIHEEIYSLVKGCLEE